MLLFSLVKCSIKNIQIKSNKTVKKLTASMVLALLKKKYMDSREWVVASEVQRMTGASDRRYDFVAMNCYNSNSYKVEVVEIKVAKSDLRRELEHPEKHNVMFDEIDYFSLAAPSEIIDMSIIPPKWGVYAVENVDGENRLLTKRKPLSLHDEPRTTISRSFAASFLRAANNQNLNRSLLYDEKKKSFDEGYQKCKLDTGYAAEHAEEFNETRKRLSKSLNMLSRLGIYGVDDMDIHGNESESKKEFDHLLKCKEICDNLSIGHLEYAINAFEHKMKDFKKTLEMFKNLELINKTNKNQ